MELLAAGWASIVILNEIYENIFFLKVNETRGRNTSLDGDARTANSNRQWIFHRDCFYKVYFAGLGVPIEHRISIFTIFMNYFAQFSEASMRSIPLT